MSMDSISSSGRKIKCQSNGLDPIQSQEELRAPADPLFQSLPTATVTHLTTLVDRAEQLSQARRSRIKWGVAAAIGAVAGLALIATGVGALAGVAVLAAAMAAAGTSLMVGSIASISAGAVVALVGGKAGHKASTIPVKALERQVRREALDQAVQSAALLPEEEVFRAINDPLNGFTQDESG